MGHAESAGRFLANLAMGLVNCRATLAPLAVFCHMDHMDMSQLHSGGAEAEICAVVAVESRDLPVRVCFWRRVILCRARPPPSPTGRISSPVHFAERQSRVSAGFLSPPAGMVGVASSGRTMGHGRAAFTCGCWCLRSGVCEGPRHDSPSASEWLGGSCTRLWALPCWPCLGVEAAPNWI